MLIWKQKIFILIYIVSYVDYQDKLNPRKYFSLKHTTKDDKI